MSVRAILSKVQFKSSITLLIFCLFDLFIVESGILKYHIVLLSISPFMFIKICFIYLAHPILGVYIFIVVILMNDPFIINEWPASLVTAFDLKSILSDVSIATTALLWIPFAWTFLFHLFTFSLYVSLRLRWVTSVELVYPFSNYMILVREQNLFTVKVIINR